MAKTAEDRKRQVVTEFRRAEILEAATQVFGVKGFEGSRMDDIAAEAGLAKATVYAYFHSKDEIYEAVVAQAMAELSVLTEQQMEQAANLADRLRAFISVRLSYWRKKEELYRVIASVNHDVRNPRRGLKWRQIAVNYLVAILTAAAKQGEIPTQDFEAAAWALMDIIRGIHERRSIRHTHAADEEEISQLMGFTLRALGYSEAKRS